ncbi:MAG: extracellular solute-binding protein [Treponema sp.]|nr:extracellular solute-binding protein [Treponema sp.]
MKKSISGVLSVFAAVLTASLFFAGCGNKDSKKVTVEIWHTYNGSQQEYLVNAAQKFNDSQNKYEVKVLAQDSAGFADTVYNAVANKVGPSIIFNYGSTAIDYAKEGLAIDITKYINEDSKKGDDSMKKIIASLPDAMQTDVKGFADGGIYYLPGCTTGPVLFYNKEIFDELKLNPPQDWDELAEVSRIIYEKKGIPGFHSDGLVDNIQMMIMQNGLGYIDVENKKVLFGSDKLVEIYQWYADCCDKGWFEFNTVGRYASEDLANGTIASFSGSCVNDQYITMLTGELGMAPWISSSNGRSFYTAWNRGPIFLARDEKVDRGAYEFAKFFLSAQMNAGWAKANSALSPYGTTQATAEYQEYINNLPETSALPCVQANLDVSGSFPNVRGAAQVRNILVEYLNNVVDKKLTAEEAVAGLVKDCNAALND